MGYTLSDYLNDLVLEDEEWEEGDLEHLSSAEEDINFDIDPEE